MTNTELYINRVLVDIPRDLGIRLNRQLLNAGELNTKDAQYSYSISLPTTDTNNRAFNYAHVEETKNKFNREYRAELYVNGVRIFTGSFRLSGIGRGGYKGNLYIPVRKSIGDIFGELKLNENPEYRIPFSDFASSINQYNTEAAAGPQMAIFPFVLYGVLPKRPLNKDANTYSPRTLWDDSVTIGIQDLAPSINPLLMLRHIFEAQGYTLQGSAFDDEKLTSLYMSYKNPDNYVQPWNYGQHAKIEVRGEWSNRVNMRTGMVNQLERGVNQGSDPAGNTYAADFFDSSNSNIIELFNPGGNLQIGTVQDGTGLEWTKAQIRIPISGYYKIRFNASVQVYDLFNIKSQDTVTGVYVIGDHSGSGSNVYADNNFLNRVYEVRLCRDRGKGEFGLSSPKLNNQFYFDNQPQNQTFDNNPDNMPKYFPELVPDGQINFVDRAQDPHHLLGFSYGQNAEPNDGISKARQQYINPQELDSSSKSLKSILVSKPAVSWKPSENTDKPTRLAIDSPGYMKYGLIGNFPDPVLDPSINYSSGPFVTGQVLDGQGNPAAPGSGNLTTRNSDYFINRFGGYLDPLTGWETSDYIDLRRWDNPEFSTTVSDNPDASILSFYDVNFQFIGSSIDGPAIGSTDTYTNQPIIASSALAVYARVCGETPVSITGTDVVTGNIILHRFGIDRFYTYKLTTNPVDGYEGFAYIHRGASNPIPVEIVPFVNGVAEFNTVYPSLFGPLDLRLTIYLKTPSYDVDGTLVISRELNDTSADVIGWEQTSKYKIQLDNAPANFAARGQYDGVTGLDQYNTAQGEANAVVWLEAGELLTVASVCTEGRYRDSGYSSSGWVAHEVKFNLSVQPFRVDEDWLKVSLSGNGTGIMDWNDPVNFDTDSINLVGFLSGDIKTDDFIENFCKAFNLRLSQISATAFALDVKQTKTSISNQYIDLDHVAPVSGRENLPLGLPSLYKLGFTVDVDEKGYDDTHEDGGGSFETGVADGEVVEQKSFFSYNWHKEITKTETAGPVILPLPIISKKDVWESSMSYPEAMTKRYTNQAYRFWYYDGLLNDLGATFSFNSNPLQIAKVSNEINGASILNYKDLQFTILDNYFTLLINGASHYTEVEGYLTPLQYQALNGSILAMFNGDLYYVAELSGYDPTARNKTKIKLIRKI